MMNKEIKTTDWLTRDIPKEQLKREKQEAIMSADLELSSEDSLSFDELAKKMFAIGYRKQRKGEWKHHKSTAGGIHDTYRCSVCDHITGWTTTFCPNCGAKMKGGK